MAAQKNSAVTQANASTWCGFVVLSAALLCAATLASEPARAQQTAPKCPPPTRTDNVKETIHGVEIADPYRWLEDQTSPETRAWIDAQNRCTEAALRRLPGREQIHKRLTELMKVDSIEVPIARNGRYFFLKRPADQDLSVLYMRAGLAGREEVLIDPQPMSSEHTTSINLLNVSNDGRMLIYGVRQGGEDEISIRLLNVEAKENFRDRLPRARYFAFGPDSVPLKPDKSGFYYSKMTNEGPRVFYHALGTEPENDPEIFGKGYGADKLMVANLSEDGRYLIILVAYGSGTERSEVYIQDLREHGPIVPVVNDLQAFFDGKIAGDTLYLVTNWEAPKWRILAVDLKNPAREHWREVVPESEARIEDFQLAGGRLAVQYTRNAVSQAKLFEPSGKPAGEIALPALGTVREFRGRWDGKEAFFSFESFPIPPTVYRYDVAAKSLTVWAKPNVPIQSDAFEVKQIWYESKDKTRVPMFLFYKKGLQLNSANPVLLTGYGGFDVSETPTFRDEAVAWAERGGVWALPNLRGGGEFGEAWHHAGMQERSRTSLTTSSQRASGSWPTNIRSRPSWRFKGAAMEACWSAQR